MTFEQAVPVEFVYPKIAPPKSMISWCYSNKIPANAAAASGHKNPQNVGGETDIVSVNRKGIKSRS
jgi:hypothetical protein